MNRVENDYSNIPLVYLTKNDLVTIELKAIALTLDECYDFLFVDSANLTEHDISASKLAWRKGRACAIHQAASSLMSSMSSRNGGNVAMDYLKTLSPTFSAEVSPSTTPGNPGFTFNVSLPE